MVMGAVSGYIQHNTICDGGFWCISISMVAELGNMGAKGVLTLHLMNTNQLRGKMVQYYLVIYNMWEEYITFHSMGGNYTIVSL